MLGLLSRFWSDDAGAVVAGEYLMVGSIVVVGGGVGLVSMRDSVAEEMKEYGRSLRAVRESNTPKRAKAATQAEAGGVLDDRPALP